MTKDLTKGPATRLIVSFAVPLLFGNLFQQFYSMVDTIVVGRFVGYQALASVGATVAIIQLLIGFALGITNGVSVVTAQLFGARREDRARRSVAMGLVISLGASVLLGAVGIVFVRPIYLLMRVPGDIIDGAVLYTVILFAGAPATLLYNYVSAILRAFGDSKTPLLALLIASAINILLDLLFVVGFGWGVAGAAVATLLSQLVAGLFCGGYALKRLPILRFCKQDFSWDGEMAANQLKVGIPMALHQSVLAVGTLIMQATLNTLGSLTVAAYTVVARIDVFLYACMSAFGTATTTFTAQNFGAGRLDRIKQGVRGTTIVTISICFVFIVALYAFSAPLMHLFVGTGEPEVIRMGIQYMRTACLFYPLLGVIFVMHSAQQGLGKTIVAMCSSFVELAARPTAAVLLTAWYGFSGFRFANPAAWSSAFVMVVISYLLIIRNMEKSAKESPSMPAQPPPLAHSHVDRIAQMAGEPRSHGSSAEILQQ